MTKVATGTYDENGNLTIGCTSVLRGVCSTCGKTWQGHVDPAQPSPCCGATIDLAALAKRFMVGPPRDVVILVHPLDGETVVDALRRHFEAAGVGTVTVATADGPRDVDVPAALAGVAVIETSLIPPGEIRLADLAIPPSAVGALKITVQP